MRWATMLLAVVVVLTAAPACTGFEAGMKAYLRGDHPTALKEWRPLAEQGNADAQFNLGVMYYFGRGVRQDYKEAVRWYRLAAAQGHASAQYKLGSMYHHGQDVPRDFVQAYMWSSLAAAQGHELARKARGLLAEKMTAEELVKASLLAREWKPKQ